MTTLALIIALTIPAVASAQEQPQQQYQQPQQPVVYPIGPPRQAYGIQLPPGGYLYEPYRPRVRGTWGIWPIPVPLGYYYY